MFYTVGVDVGSNSVKTAVLELDDRGENPRLIAHEVEKIRKRNVKDVVESSYQRVLGLAGISSSEVVYVASTGEGELVDFRRGHFYSMTCHARGALLLDASVRAVVDIGALHAKALVMDSRSKVLEYKMTSQCASGSGQFLENIARYLGLAVDDIGELSMKADQPELPSSICAVLAETDVINMVSRGITTPNILKGIHLSMARRLVNLLKMLKASGTVLLTGGLARDIGLIGAIEELAKKDKLGIEVRSHELSILAGAIGAGIWAGYRHVRLRSQSGQVAI